MTDLSSRFPGEIRDRIYKEYARSCSITLHPERTLSEPSVSEDDEDSEVRATAPQTCMAMAILATSKNIRREAQWSFYTESSFTLKRRSSLSSDWTECGIDRRIQHLTIEQEPYNYLWYGTILFLDRHFEEKDVSMKELKVPNDGFQIEDEMELQAFLKTTLQRVDVLTFQVAINEATPHFHPIFGVRRYFMPTRQCQVQIRRNGGICITTSREDDYEEVKSRLTEAVEGLGQSVEQENFHWLK